jgi:hypothetical protein
MAPIPTTQLYAIPPLNEILGGASLIFYGWTKIQARTRQLALLLRHLFWFRVSHTSKAQCGAFWRYWSSCNRRWERDEECTPLSPGRSWRAVAVDMYLFHAMESRAFEAALFSERQEWTRTDRYLEIFALTLMVHLASWWLRINPFLEQLHWTWILFKASDFYKINNGECAACFVRKWESIGQVWLWCVEGYTWHWHMWYTSAFGQHGRRSGGLTILLHHRNTTN